MAITESASIASGHGIATVTDSGKVLDVWYPEPKLRAISGEPSAELKALVGIDENRGIKRELVSIEIELAKAPADAKDACDRQAKKLVGEGRAFKDMKSWQSYYANLYYEGSQA